MQLSWLRVVLWKVVVLQHVSEKARQSGTNLMRKMGICTENDALRSR
jgi:hypothetical protein